MLMYHGKSTSTMHASQSPSFHFTGGKSSPDAPSSDMMFVTPTPRCVASLSSQPDVLDLYTDPTKLQLRPTSHPVGITPTADPCSPSFLERFLQSEDREEDAFLFATRPSMASSPVVVDMFSETSSENETASARSNRDGGAQPADAPHERQQSDDRIHSLKEMTADVNDDENGIPSWRRSVMRLLTTAPTSGRDIRRPAQSALKPLPRFQPRTDSVAPFRLTRAVSVATAPSCSSPLVDVSDLTDEAEASQIEAKHRFSSHIQPFPVSPPPGECVERALLFKAASPSTDNQPWTRHSEDKGPLLLSTPNSGGVILSSRNTQPSPSRIPSPERTVPEVVDTLVNAIRTTTSPSAPQGTSAAPPALMSAAAYPQYESCGTPAFSLASYLRQSPERKVVYIEVSPGRSVPLELTFGDDAKVLAATFLAGSGLGSVADSAKGPLVSFIQMELEGLRPRTAPQSHQPAARPTDPPVGEPPAPRATSQLSRSLSSTPQGRMAALSGPQPTRVLLARNVLSAVQSHPQKSRSSSKGRSLESHPPPTPQPTRAFLLRTQATKQRVELFDKERTTVLEKGFHHLATRQVRGTIPHREGHARPKSADTVAAPLAQRSMPEATRRTSRPPSRSASAKSTHPPRSSNNSGEMVSAYTAHNVPLPSSKVKNPTQREKTERTVPQPPEYAATRPRDELRPQSRGRHASRFRSTEEIELDEHCTFKPTINPTSQRIFRQLGEPAMQHQAATTVVTSTAVPPPSEEEISSAAGSTSSCRSVSRPLASPSEVLSFRSHSNRRSESPPQYIPNKQLFVSLPPPLHSSSPSLTPTHSLVGKEKGRITRLIARDKQLAAREDQFRLRRLAEMKKMLNATSPEPETEHPAFRPFLGR